MVRVMYTTEDLPLGTISVMPKRTFEKVVTPVPTDWNTLQDTQSRAIQEELAKVVLEWDVQYDDINKVILGLTEKLYAAFDRATNFLWTGEDKGFVAGKTSPVGFRTILEANEILERIGKKVEDEPSKPTTKKDSGDDDSGKSGAVAS